MLQQIDLIFTGPSVRLDKYLKQKNQYLTQGIIEKALRKGDIKVNNKKAKSNLRLQEQDIVNVAQFIMAMSNDNARNNEIKITIPATILASKVLKDYLIYDHPEFIAINKPAGLSTQGGSKIDLSLNDALNVLNMDKKGDFKLVHRTDKATSGILLVAKNYNAAVALTNAFKEKIILKKYLAIVEGHLEQEEGELRDYIKKNLADKYQTIMRSEVEGKLAITRYKLIKKLVGDFKMIEFLPLTGRMHQLRFHAKILGCPIVGDKKYGNKDNHNISSKMLLHAKEIMLPKEIFGEEIFINAPVPSYFDLKNFT